MKKTLSLIAALLATGLTALHAVAGDDASSKKVIAPVEQTLFRAKEFQVDISSFGLAGDYKSGSVDAVGGNLGLSYFLTRCLGVGVDNGVGGYQASGMSNAVGCDVLQADLIARYPMESLHLAPYAMLGGGTAWSNSSQGNGNLGGGVEYRVNPSLGLFADCRWLYGDNNYSAALPRAGVRFIF